MNGNSVAKRFPTGLPPIKTPYQWVFHNETLIEHPSSPLLTCEQIDNQFLITIPKNCVLDSPLYLIHLIESKSPHASSNIKIIAEQNANACVIELFLYQGNLSSSFNNTTQIILNAKAFVHHQRLTHGIDAGFSATSNILIQQFEHSEYHGCLVSFGMATHHSLVHLELQAPYAKTFFNTLMAPIKTQKMKVDVTINHLAPLCQSHVIARGVINHRAQSHFIGKIIVAPFATKTNARLENKNLVLSNEAQAFTQPLLEIYNDDVQCSHGATIGHLDDSALFYLRSRGISEIEASQMLIDAFVYPILHNIEHPDLRYHIEGLIHAN
jgi:Fe-S cluster assembly protein SufD